MNNDNRYVDWEFKASILSCQRPAEASLTARQLTRWHVEGLIPRPRQVQLPGKRGGTTVYPPGTLHQVNSLIVIAKAFGRREDRGWYLWRLGYPVGQQYWKPHFERAIENIKGFRDFAIDRSDIVPGLTHKAERATSHWSNNPISHPIGGPLKQKLGNQVFESVLNDLMLVFSGSFEFGQGYDSARVLHALGETNLSNSEVPGFFEFLARHAEQIEFFRNFDLNHLNQSKEIILEWETITKLRQFICALAQGERTADAPEDRLNCGSKMFQAGLLLFWTVVRQYPPFQPILRKLFEHIYSAETR